MCPAKKVSGDTVVDALVGLTRDEEKPYATTTDLAEELDVTAQTIRNNASDIAEDPRVKKGKVGQSSVYWLAVKYDPEELDEPPETEPPANDMTNEEDIEESAGLIRDDLGESETEGESEPGVESAGMAEVSQSPPAPDRETVFRRHSLTLAELSLVVLGTTIVWAVGLELLAFAGLVTLVEINPVPVALLLGLSALGVSSGILGLVFAPVVPIVESFLGIEDAEVGA